MGDEVEATTASADDPPPPEAALALARALARMIAAEQFSQDRREDIELGQKSSQGFTRTGVGDIKRTPRS